MIEGRLVELRAVEREDLPRYVNWLNDPEVIHYFGRLGPMSLVEEEQWFEDQLKQSNVRNFSVYYQGEHVGGAGYCRIDSRARNAEIGLFIGRKDLWDEGLGTDVMTTLVRFGFEQMNLHRIYLRAYEENTRGIKCYEKAGFKYEGRWRHAEFRHGRYHDMLWMSILEDEYRVSIKQFRAT